MPFKMLMPILDREGRVDVDEASNMSSVEPPVEGSKLDNQRAACPVRRSRAPLILLSASRSPLLLGVVLQPLLSHWTYNWVRRDNKQVHVQGRL